MRVKLTDLVGLTKVQDPKEIKDALLKTLELIGFKPEKHVKTVVIKPNLCYYWKSSTGYTTDPQLVGGIIDVLREMYNKNLDIKIAEADATAMKTKYAFKMLDYEKLSKEKDVELFNLSEDILEDKEVQVNNRKIKFKIPQILLNADLFINVPKLKVMRITTITCAFKNMFGATGYPRKIKYHPFLNEAIVGINKILRPNLTIVDGLVALGRFPVKMGLILASTDSFSVDWVAAQIMGYNPSRIKFLKIAVEENLGNPQNIEIVGESIKTFRKEFPRPSRFSKLLWSFQLSMLKLYVKVTGDLVPSFLEEA